MVSLSENRMVAFLNDSRVTLAFKVLYLLLALASFNGFVAFSAGLSAAAYVVAAIGAVLLAARLVRLRSVLSFPLALLLVGFLASYLLSWALAPRPAGALESMQGFVWLCLEFLLLYVWAGKPTVFEIKRDLRVFLGVFCAYVLVASVVGLCMAVAGFSYSNATDVMQQRNIGIVSGRLWGVYSDPNYGSVFAAVSVLVSIFLLGRSGRRAAKAFAVANVVVQLSYIALSGSRTGMLSLVVSTVPLLILLIVRSDGAAGVPFARRVGRGVAASVAWIAVVLLALWAVPAAYNAYGSYMQDRRTAAWEQYQEREQSASATEEEKRQAKEDADRLDDVMVGTHGETGLMEREQSLDDQSSGRIQIWKDALDVAAENPLVGVSYRSLGTYVKADMPDLMIAQKGYTSMHNVFVDVLVGQGLVGLVVFVCFLAGGFVRLIALMRKVASHDFPLVCTCALALVAIFVSSLLYSEILYINTAGSVLFWTVSGCLMAWSSVLGDSSERRSLDENMPCE